MVQNPRVGIFLRRTSPQLCQELSRPKYSHQDPKFLDLEEKILLWIMCILDLENLKCCCVLWILDLEGGKMSVNHVNPGSWVTGNVDGSCGSCILTFLFVVGSCGSWILEFRSHPSLTLTRVAESESPGVVATV